MLQESSIENYLREAYELLSEQERLPELLTLIEQQLQKYEENSLLHTFFLAENAFFTQNYRDALKFYMECKQLPLYRFFCYRTCAFIFTQEKRREKALDFVQKALQLDPSDPVTLGLKERIEHEEVEQKLFDPSDLLEKRMHEFVQSHKNRLRQYIAGEKSSKESALYVIENWHEVDHFSTATSGGYFLRWLGKGVVINPGPHFIDSLRKRGLHIGDIDYVIVTKEPKDRYAEIQKLHQLNAQLNQERESIHTIHYYLSQPCYQLQAPYLLPHFKQERGSIHCLELYADSLEIESIELCDFITLRYFPLPKSLGICIDFTHPDQTAMHVGYASGSNWSPSTAHFYQNCHLLIAAVGDVDCDDIDQIDKKADCLGYFGCLELIEQIQPRVALCCEYSGLQGDIRLELIRKMRSAIQGTTILPGEGIGIDLETLQVECSNEWIDPALVRVVRTADHFGALCFLTPQAIL